MCSSIYTVQSLILVNFMAEHISKCLWFFSLLFVPFIYLFVKYLIKVSVAKNNNELRGLLWIWAIYIKQLLSLGRALHSIR